MVPVSMLRPCNARDNPAGASAAASHQLLASKWLPRNGAQLVEWKAKQLQTGIQRPAAFSGQAQGAAVGPAQGEAVGPAQGEAVGPAQGEAVGPEQGEAV